MENEIPKSEVPCIEIEQMLFGDYRVQVWDERLDSMLDREYFCRGIGSAVHTAINLQHDTFPELPVYLRKAWEPVKKLFDPYKPNEVVQPEE